MFISLLNYSVRIHKKLPLALRKTEFIEIYEPFRRRR